MEVKSDKCCLKDGESGDEDNSTKLTVVGANESASPENVQLIDGGKKDPYLRRKELLVENGLAEVSLILSLSLYLCGSFHFNSFLRFFYVH